MGRAHSVERTSVTPRRYLPAALADRNLFYQLFCGQ